MAHLALNCILPCDSSAFISCIIISSAKCGCHSHCPQYEVLSLPSPIPRKTEMWFPEARRESPLLGLALKLHGNPKRIECREWNRYLCIHVHISIIHNRQMWKQAKCPLSNEWINTMQSIHTMEHYSALQRHAILIILQHR